MRKFMMLASAAAMAVSMPAIAQAQGKGKGASGKAQASAQMKRNNVQARTNVRVQRQDARQTQRNMRVNGRLDANNNGVLDRYERDSDGDGDGILDYREGTVQTNQDRNGNGILDRYEMRNRNVNFCPPGLATKTPACVPPGLAGQTYMQGQRLPSGYRYVEVPVQYRSQITGYDPDRYRYYYGQDRVYVVDPATRLITSIVDLVL